MLLRETERKSALELLTFDPGPYAYAAVKVGNFEPDAFVRVGLAGKVYPWFIEVDEGTEDRSQIEVKLEQYRRAYLDWPGRRPAVLFVAIEERREQQLERWLQDREVGSYVGVATLEQASGVLAGGWLGRQEDQSSA